MSLRAGYTRLLQFPPLITAEYSSIRILFSLIGQEEKAYDIRSSALLRYMYEAFGPRTEEKRIVFCILYEYGGVRLR
jgi:hypothetical protein